MASIMSSGSGLWSEVVNANDGDSVTIGANHDVVFDVDQSGWSTGLTGLVINALASLKFKSDADTCLMMASGIHITGIGTFGNPSTDPVQRPSVGNAYRCRIILKGSSQIRLTSGSGIVDLEGWTPTLNHTTLHQGAVLSATEIVLSEDLDLQQGDEIIIGSGTENGVMTEANKGVYTVSSYNSSTKTVTLTSGLQTARLEGDYVAWISRPIHIERKPAANTTISNMAGAKFVGVKMLNMGIPNHSNANIGFCTFKDGQNSLTAPTGGYFNDCTSTNITYGNYGWGSSGCTLLRCISFNAPHAGFYTLFVCYVMKCVFQNGTSIAKSAYGSRFAQCVGLNNSVADLEIIYECELFDGELNSSIQVANYSTNNTRKWINNESFDHNDIPGFYRSWMKGGYIYTDTTVSPSGKESSLKFVIEQADTPVFREFFLYYPPNKNIKFKIKAKKDFNGGTVKLQLVNPEKDPIIDITEDALAETTMQDIKDEWVTMQIKYKSEYRRPLLLRVYGEHTTTGNIWIEDSEINKVLGKHNIIILS